MGKIHLIMPMGGAGSRFAQIGVEMPKPLINIKGKPFFYWATQSIAKYVDCEDITFVVLKDHVDKFEIDKVIKSYFSNAIIKMIPSVLPGPLFTCMSGVEEIDDDLPIIFNDCDHMFKCKELYTDINTDQMLSDGALLTFTSRDPRFSYVLLSPNKGIMGTVEKKVVSNQAICGAYLFKNKKIFLRMSEEYLKSCPYDEYFMSGMYNVMCKKKLMVKNYNLDFHVDYGTPNDFIISQESPYFEILDKEGI